MTGAWASLIAVGGTLVGVLGGAALSYLFQRKTDERAVATSRDNQLRQERLAAYSMFAGAVMDFRGVQYSRRHSRLFDPAGKVDRSGIRSESSQLRSAAWSAFYRFKLTSPSEQLTALALQAITEAGEIADADDRADLSRRSEQARKYIDRFITAAADFIQPTESG